MPTIAHLQGKFCRTQAWRIRNLITIFARLAKLPHRPTEENIRKMYEILGIPIPAGILLELFLQPADVPPNVTQ